MTEPFDENAQALDAWTADPERTREEFFYAYTPEAPFFVADRPRAPAKADSPKWPLACFVAAGLAALVYCALRYLP